MSTKKPSPDRLLDDIDSVLFEGATCREWIVEIRDRADKLIERSKQLAVFKTDEDLTEQLAELKEARVALHRAAAELRVIQLAVEKRENY